MGEKKETPKVEGVKVCLIGDPAFQMYNLAAPGDAEDVYRAGEEVEVDAEFAELLVKNECAEIVK